MLVVSREVADTQVLKPGPKAGLQKIFPVPCPIESKFLFCQVSEQQIFRFCRRDHGGCILSSTCQYSLGTAASKVGRDRSGSSDPSGTITILCRSRRVLLDKVRATDRQATDALASGGKHSVCDSWTDQRCASFTNTTQLLTTIDDVHIDNRRYLQFR